MKANRALILIDPLNDFLHPDGKLYRSVQKSIERSQTVKNLQVLVQGARNKNIPIFYALHQQTHDRVYEGWQHMNPSFNKLKELKAFEEGSSGAQIYDGLEPQASNGDVVVSRHWNSSGFENTDLNYQLRQRAITHVTLAGMTANTCLESTARYAREYGYHVTLLTDATAGFSPELTEVATTLVWPVIAENVNTVEGWIASLDNTAANL